MHRIPSSTLWVGHVGDARDLTGLLARGITAVVDLASDESPMVVTRDLVSCRFPLVDGSGNDPWLLLLAIRTITGLIVADVPTLVYCGAGMSRTPAISAAALAIASGRPLDECLAEVVGGRPVDISPGLWIDVTSLMHADMKAEKPLTP
jgi:hypothetical protein